MIRSPSLRFAITLFGLVALVGSLTLACAQAPELRRPLVRTRVDFRADEGMRVHVVTPFEDERETAACQGPAEGKKTSSGRTKKGTSSSRPMFRMQLLCSKAPPTWLAEDLIEALESADFEVVEEGPFDADVLQVRGTLLMAEVEVMAQMQSVLSESDYRVRLEVTNGAGLVASRNFHVKSQDVVTVGSPDQTVLDKTHGRTVRTMAAAILTLANRYARLGETPAEWSGPGDGAQWARLNGEGAAR
ncbi:MAG: hypothetical protein AAGC67_00510 [Myxococcota bacterium]